MGEGGEGEDTGFADLARQPPRLSVANFGPLPPPEVLPELSAGPDGRPLTPRAAGDKRLQKELEERTTQLNGLFEQQLKTQYESMKSEASKLGRRHQRDVAQLDERFQHKMGGVAQRVKQLEAEEGQMEATP